MPVFDARSFREMGTMICPIGARRRSSPCAGSELKISENESAIETVSLNWASPARWERQPNQLESRTLSTSNTCAHWEGIGA
jgi:hypothetical protein